MANDVSGQPVPILAFNFSMTFDGGFKLADSARELLDIMPKVERVHIMDYEEMLTRPLFFKSDYVPPVIDYRCIYAVMHSWYVGIFIDEEMLVDVLERLPFAEVVVHASTSNGSRHLPADLLTGKALRCQD